MANEIIVALITGGLSFLGVVITNISSNRKMQSELKVNQAVTETKIEELTREVREHNNFAHRMPALEQRIENEEKRIDRDEKRLLEVEKKVN